MSCHGSIRLRRSYSYKPTEKLGDGIADASRLSDGHIKAFEASSLAIWFYIVVGRKEPH